jgi:transcriptional regulator with GAF, ATPase, and Fis domain
MGDDSTKTPPAEEKQAQEFLKVFRRGVQFTEELLLENERMRFRVAQLEQEVNAINRHAGDNESFRELLDKLRELEEEKHDLARRYESVERENLDYKNRYVEIEQEYDRLANLYVASYQLHSTLDLDEAIRISFEILINLVGSRWIALYVAEGDRFVPVRAEGLDLSKVDSIGPESGSLAQSLHHASLYVREDAFANPEQPLPRVGVPLKAGNQLFGALVVLGFLSQKADMTDLDHELFKLLAAHASMALYSACMFSQVKSDHREFLQALRQCVD